MKFTFADITLSEIYETAKVLIITGQYSIFNNIAIDTVRDTCKSHDLVEMDSDLADDFGIEGGSSKSTSMPNNVDLDTFIRVINVVSMAGKWFCNADYSFLNKKQKEWINNYIKDPSDNGKLVINCTDFRDYKFFLRNKIALNSAFVHIIQLNFPNRATLKTIVKALFEEKGVYIEQSAIELFIMRMSSSYDDYTEVIDEIILESVPSDSSSEKAADWKYTITYEDTLNAMKGIENFVIDDLLYKLLVPLSSDKGSGNSKVYKMVTSLIKEMGAKQLLNKLKYKIDDYIDFRLAINNGFIPVLVKFSVPEAKGRLGKEAKICRYSDYTFRKMANIASQTSLKDWLYMKLMINNIGNMYSETSYERALHALVNRSVLTESRLNNDIGIENIYYLSVNELDKQRYTDDKLLFSINNTGGIKDGTS